MVRRRSRLLSAVVVCRLVLLSTLLAAGQEVVEHGATPGGAVSSARSRAVPADAGPYSEPEFVGSYGPDGRFRGPSTIASPLKTRGFAPSFQRQGTLSQVPTWIDLHDPSETVVADYAPPAYAHKKPRGKSAAGSLFQSLVLFAYGRRPVLGTPTHVATNSRQQVIISDPLAPAVQVLDGNTSFRIVGGAEHRLQRPGGVAVDAGDNIYVADSKTGRIAVYDPEGRFLRYMGGYRGENMFQAPTGIGIDRTHGRLYVLDTPAGELVMLDLQGKLLQRVGGRRQLHGVNFDLPTEIAVGDSSLVVLDSSGTRLQELDLECNPLRSFRIGAVNGPPIMIPMGVAMDHAGNIYVSSGGWSGVRVFSRDGRLLGSFGGFGKRKNEFDHPSGLWMDSANRLYVADTRNSRIQVFQPAGRATATNTHPAESGSPAAAAAFRP